MRRSLGVSSLLTVAWLLISTFSCQITTVNNTHDLTCTEPRETSDGLAQTIAQGIASTSAVANACSASLQHNSTDGPNTILNHTLGSNEFSISYSSDAPPTTSPDLFWNIFSSIICTCIGDTAPPYWDGYWQQNDGKAPCTIDCFTPAVRQ